MFGKFVKCEKLFFNHSYTTHSYPEHCLRHTYTQPPLRIILDPSLYMKNIFKSALNEIFRRRAKYRFIDAIWSLFKGRDFKMSFQSFHVLKSIGLNRMYG